MEYTTNLNLKKPDINEYYNIVEQENENADIIDEAIGKLNKNFDYSGEYSAYGVWCIGNYGNCYLVVSSNMPITSDEYNINVTYVGLGGLTATETIEFDVATIVDGNIMINCPSAIEAIKDSGYVRLGNTRFTLTKK